MFFNQPMRAKGTTMTYTVGEAAKILGVPASTLRYYEGQGLLPAVERTPGGQRQFSAKDMEACRVIECLKASGLSIKDIKRFMDLVVEGDSTLRDRLALFEGRREAMRAEIAQMERTLAFLEFKCWYYGSAVEAGTEDAVRDLPEAQIPAQHRAAKAMLEGR